MKNSNQTLENAQNVSKMFAGYGHNKVTVSFNDGSQLSATTSNTRLTDALDSEDEKEAEEAKIDAIQFVLDANDEKVN